MTSKPGEHRDRPHQPVFKDYRINASISESGSHVAGRSISCWQSAWEQAPASRRSTPGWTKWPRSSAPARGEPTPVRLRRLPLALELPHLTRNRRSPIRTAHPAAHHALWADVRVRWLHERRDCGSGCHAAFADRRHHRQRQSVLLATMLWSLTANTSPTDLRLVLVDLKNEDLVPFASLHRIPTSRRQPARRGRGDCETARHQRAPRAPSQQPATHRAGHRQMAELARLKDPMRQLASISPSAAARASTCWPRHRSHSTIVGDRQTNFTRDSSVAS